MKFNTTILLKNTWTKDKSMTVNLTGPLDTYDYTWEVVNATKYMSVVTDTLYVKINYKGQLFDYDLEKVTLTFHDLTQIYDSINGYDMIDTGFNFYLKGQETDIKDSYFIGFWMIVALYGLV